VPPVNDTFSGQAQSGRAQRFWRAPGLWQAVFALAFLLIWIVAARLLPSYLVPGPVEVATNILQFITVPALARNVVASLVHVAAAVCISFLISVALALLAHYWPVFRTLIHRRISPFLNSFSGIGWALLAVLWFGISPFTVIFSVTVILLPFGLINMREGLESLDREIIEMGRSFSRSAWRNIRLIILPLLLPFLVATLRISFGVAWKVTLTAELLGGDRGLGYIINIAMQEQNTARILAASLLIVVFVRLMDRYGFELLQRRLSQAYRSA
jgi:NitT/TauT family transport system permease protein